MQQNQTLINSKFYLKESRRYRWNFFYLYRYSLSPSGFQILFLHPYHFSIFVSPSIFSLARSSLAKDAKAPRFFILKITTIAFATRYRLRVSKSFFYIQILFLHPYPFSLLFILSPARPSLKTRRRQGLFYLNYLQRVFEPPNTRKARKVDALIMLMAQNMQASRLRSQVLCF